MEDLNNKFQTACGTEDINITPSNLQTKDWRKSQSWYNDGKHNECENYQREIIEKIVTNKLEKTNDRIHMKKLKIISKTSPMNDIDCFEWTENFDGILNINNNKIYFNLKFVCDAGGAQTRTLREVAMFIKKMLHYLRYRKTNNVYFINILDGDCSNKYLDSFKYYLNRETYEEFKKYIFIGDLHQFNKYWKDFKNI